MATMQTARSAPLSAYWHTAKQMEAMHETVRPPWKRTWPPAVQHSVMTMVQETITVLRRVVAVSMAKTAPRAPHGYGSPAEMTQPPAVYPWIALTVLRMTSSVDAPAIPGTCPCFHGDARHHAATVLIHHVPRASAPALPSALTLFQMAVDRPLAVNVTAAVTRNVRPMKSSVAALVISEKCQESPKAVYRLAATALNPSARTFVRSVWRSVPVLRSQSLEIVHNHNVSVPIRNVLTRPPSAPQHVTGNRDLMFPRAAPFHAAIVQTPSVHPKRRCAPEPAPAEKTPSFRRAALRHAVSVMTRANQIAPNHVMRPPSSRCRSA